jgi:hypothetical protein
MGLLATNTIAQGDTRQSALKPLLQAGFRIFNATRSLPWPGEAAVTVAVVHLSIGNAPPRSCVLDGTAVPMINSRLRAGDERPDPMALGENKSKSFLGFKVYGQGFVLTPEERDVLVRKSVKNAERTFPYLGGEEVNSSPTHAFDRYVINFGDIPLDEAARWPDLLQIVRDKVKPERERNKRDAQRRYWWQFGEKQPGLVAALAKLDRCLVISIHTKHLAFVFQPTTYVFSHACYVFALSRDSHFALLQSRVHEAWARLLSSSMKTDLRYSGSDCFDTFPFPAQLQLAELDPIGEALYERRARLMQESAQGLTDTYNDLKDPDYDSDRLAAVEELRVLHEQLDRAVLAAYGWNDIEVPPFCPKTDAAQAAFARFEDTVIDRLFALNAQRAAEERGVDVEISKPPPPRQSKPRKRKPQAPKSQTSMLDEE